MLQLPKVPSDVQSPAADTKAISLLAGTRPANRKVTRLGPGMLVAGTFPVWPEVPVCRVGPASRPVPRVPAEFHSRIFCPGLRRTAGMCAEGFCRAEGGGSRRKEKDLHFKGHTWCLSGKSEGPAVHDPTSLPQSPFLCFPFPSCFEARLRDHSRFPIQALSPCESREVHISDPPRTVCTGSLWGGDTVSSNVTRGVRSFMPAMAAAVSSPKSHTLAAVAPRSPGSSVGHKLKLACK